MGSPSAEAHLDSGHVTHLVCVPCRCQCDVEDPTSGLLKMWDERHRGCGAERGTDEG